MRPPSDYMCLRLFILSLFFTVSAVNPPSELFSPLIAQKVLAVAQTEPSPVGYPQYTDRNVGRWLYFPADTWTSGFFPSTLYEMNTRENLCPRHPGSTPARGYSDRPDWVELGRQWSTGEIPLEVRTSVGHDRGFLSFPFEEELAINPQNQTALAAVNAFAKGLADRFDATVGCTRSWDTSDPTLFQVIIDNMMNLEVLFVSESLTGNHTLRDIAISHADKTIENHIRSDGGSYHLVEYNATTGDVIDRLTVQGFANNSTWSRGQAWAIFGFANMYQRTKMVRYIETARRTATYFVNNLPSDGVPPWDFNAPDTPLRPADSSAATIAATGLLLLSQMESSVYNITGARFWSDAAIQILNAITTLAWKPEWQSLLSNGTVNNPASNNLTGIVYGDYYYIKAGNLLVSMGLANCGPA